MPAGTAIHSCNSTPPSLHGIDSERCCPDLRCLSRFKFRLAPGRA